MSFNEEEIITRLDEFKDGNNYLVMIDGDYNALNGIYTYVEKSSNIHVITFINSTYQLKILTELIGDSIENVCFMGGEATKINSKLGRYYFADDCCIFKIATNNNLSRVIKFLVTYFKKGRAGCPRKKLKYFSA